MPTDMKKAALLAACPPENPGRQSRLPLLRQRADYVPEHELMQEGPKVADFPPLRIDERALKVAVLGFL